MTLQHPMCPPPRAATRRDFLSQAAAVAAGGVLAVSPALASRDPVFALIDAHKAAEAALEATLHDNSRLEGAAKKYDDSLAMAAHDAEQEALNELVETVPTTLQGVIASLHYLGEEIDHGYGRITDDEIQPLLANLCEALRTIAARS
jgi:hypothetical protein